MADRTEARTRVIRAPAPSLCLDFVNTRYWRGMPRPSEDLGDFQALRGWLRRSATLDAEADACLEALDAAAAQRLFDAALDARESLYRLLHALTDEKPAPSGLAALLRQVSAAPPRHEAVCGARQTGWRVPMRSPDVAEVLAPVWWSAADLLLGPGRLRLRCCANPRCGWLFLDDSKGGTRRWCSMSACGNRAKVQRHAQRRRALVPMRDAGSSR